MPILANPRHEKFAQELAAGKSASEAYVLAGFKKNDGNCIRLKGNERIQARLAELQEAAARKSEITIESICRELDEANAVAKARGQASAMVSASALRAKLAGLMVERQKVEVGGPGDFSQCNTVEAVVDELLQLAGVHHYQDLGDGDRDHLAALFARCFEEADAYIGAIKNRPYRTSHQAKALPPPHANGKSRV